MEKGLVFNIQRYSIEDGPGIRTTIFFKGCPLRCPWCSNPESQNPFLEIMSVNSLCNKCGRCIDVCDMSAIRLTDKGVKIDRKLCTNCPKCVEVCPTNALKLTGKEMTVGEVIHEVIQDRIFYINSNGGVTISGGEPLMQADFATAIFKQCRKSAIHTCLDTCLYSSSRNLGKVLKYTDLVLADLKLMDFRSHRELLKRSNRQILQNFGLIVAKKIPVIPRIPLIPGITDTEENLRDIARFIAGLNTITKVHIMPYHRYGIKKYEMLGRQYRLSELRPPTEEQCQRAKQIFQSYGLSMELPSGAEE